MSCPPTHRKSNCVIGLLFASAALASCTGSQSIDFGGDGGSSGEGGTPGTGGIVEPGTGGIVGTGGSGTGGVVTGTGGHTGGTTGTGGATGGTPGTAGKGGSGGHAGSGGTMGAAGHAGTTGAAGVSGTAGATGATGAGGAIDACASAPALSGGSQHCSSNTNGTVNGYSWTIWSSGGGGCMTTYTGADAAFSATWNNSGDFLARVGLQWDRTKTYDQLGTIGADFAQTHTGSGGSYSYIGIYGWSVSPTHEYYIVEDSYGKMPVNPGGTKMGSAMIDGATYTFYSRQASGASIDGSSSFVQFYSVRATSRACGHISLSDHFKAWAAAGMTLGKMEEAKLLLEAGGGSGSGSFTVGSFTVTQ
ncbi:MAG TPA: glycoside hydrolase family 11 protein [Polyangia bacterium]|nr:glycoside hydrolase family 11 protein [Polyangia bacterium]